jgi:hypothetical protein
LDPCGPAIWLFSQKQEITVSEQLTFDGHPVSLRVVNTLGGNRDVVISCKGVVGLYSQARKFYQREFSPDGAYSFGVRKKDKCQIKSTPDGGRVKVACLEGTREEAAMVMQECRRMLSGEKSQVNY